MSATTVATCRYCGAQGLEDAGDVAPGVCPSCLDARMRECLRRFKGALEGGSVSAALSQARADLQAIAGLTEDASRAFVLSLLARYVGANP